jgi:hypothetical protein
MSDLEKLREVMRTGAWLTVDELSTMLLLPREEVLGLLNQVQRRAQRRGSSVFGIWEYQLDEA